MTERDVLKGSILLCGESDGTRFTRRFQIVKKVSEGTYSLCYEAYHEKSGRGILKEFYPKDAAIAAERDAQGQLFFPQGTEAYRDKFACQLKRYLEAYQMLVEVKQKQETSELESFIPAFEIYYGCDEEKNLTGTAYIWTTEPKREPFQKFCEEIHQHPDVSPEQKMVTALRGVETLTKCICVLHNAGMVHRDIKPSNFGFVRRGREILTQTLSMFDIDSICSVYDPPEDIMGTGGFMEPESEYERPNNQTDIYAIGATLFYAIAGSDEVKDSEYQYRKEYYPRLRELLNSSDLVCAAEANAHPRLRDTLVRILEKSLCERSSRYQCCEQLLEELETALYYALPSEVAKKVRSGQHWVLQDAQKAWKRNKEKNTFQAIQYHLYRYPLYRSFPKNAPVLNVLLAGFGNVGQKFLDACLQVGQLPGKKLSVAVLTDDLGDRELYLADRPELAEFFDIDGSLPEGQQSYGQIRFHELKLSEDDTEKNIGLLQNYLQKLSEEEKPHYIFAALGDDAVNLSAAKACRGAAGELGISCEISCVCENKYFPAKKVPGVQPVFVGADIKKDPLYPEIERMAFNCHLAWEKNLNTDFRKIKARYQRPYNHDSSVANVLSLKYKLYGIGIDLDKTDTQKAAALAAGRGLSSEKRDNPVKNELIWLEHRRWVTEKLCQGWRRIRDLEECMEGVTADERRKRHVCLLPSRPDQMLAEQFCKNGKYELWDKEGETDLEMLDDLDRMSVLLHRAYARKAAVSRKKNLLTGSIMQSIRTQLEDHKKALGAFQEWYLCLQDIWTGDRGKNNLYRGLKDDFMEAAEEELTPSAFQVLEEQVKAFEVLFTPVRLCIEYKNWKDEDTKLIENIPFVLTYTENTYMVIPFQTGSSTEVFQNVAAATVVNPAKILYLFLAEKKEDIKNLRKSFPYIFSYMEKKEIRAEVELILGYRSAVISEVDNGLVPQLERMSGDRPCKVRLRYAADTRSMLLDLEDYLRQRSQNKQVFILEHQENRLSGLLEGAGIYDRFPHYRFESGTMTFTTSGDCEMLRYIRKKTFITAEDLAAVRRAAGSGSSRPEFYRDYKSLWDKYKNNPAAWKKLCETLAEYASEKDTLAVFREQEKQKESEPFSYLLPFACSRSAARIIEFLEKNGIVEKDSHVDAFSTEACEVIIRDRCGNKEQYDRLFSRVYELTDPDAVTIWMDSKTRKVRVQFDDLRAEAVPLEKKWKNSQLSLLRFFQNMDYIRCLKETEESVSFIYATRQIKELLTTAGKMLEIYTYHKAKETGQFDDIASSFEIEWGGTENLCNEFDCILTKGFRTLFVECKARAEIDQDFYFKISDLVRRFGINATAVLIADTREEEQSELARRNEMQRKRGSEMDVITVWKKDEIYNIGHTLLRIINGKYVIPEEI